MPSSIHEHGDCHVLWRGLILSGNDTGSLVIEAERVEHVDIDVPADAGGLCALLVFRINALLDLR